MRITVTGAAEVAARLRALPDRLRHGLQEATPRALELEKRVEGSGSRVRRDPAVLLDLLLTARGDDA